MENLPKVAIIILNWNGYVDTLACLESLQDLNYQNHHIYVIDNGSTDESVSVIQDAYPHLTLLETGKNLGFVGGNNLGITSAMSSGADYVLLLNNDTEVNPDFLQLLVDVAESIPQVGVVGPSIYYFEEPERIWSSGGHINWNRGSTRMLGLDEIDTGQFGNQPRTVDFITGCAMLAKTSLIEQVGMLDDRFFAYYEEAEWCVRISRAGNKILHVPQAKIWHKISPEAREASPIVHYYMTRNRLLFLKLTNAGLSAWLNTLILEYLRTLLSWTIRSKWKHKAIQRRMMIKAILDFGSSRFGPATR